MLLFGFIIFKIICLAQQEINYTITSPSIKIDYCNHSEGVLLFHIEGKIEPYPYCDMKFDLSLLKPSSTNAECVLFDDVDNRINCSLNIGSTFGEIQIKKQLIKLNKYRVSIDFLDFPNNLIKINCNDLFLTNNYFIKPIFVLIFYLFL
jgi:hypothetical protein